MDIIKPDGTTIQVIVTEAAQHVQELMGEDYVKLSWMSDECAELSVGSYIVPFEDGVRYTLFKAYMPRCVNLGEYSYEPQFEHPKMILAHTPLLLTTRVADGREVRETDWEYTGNAGTILARIADIISDETGETLSIVLLDYDGKLPASASVSFSGVDVLSGLSTVAQAFDNAEYYIDWESKILYFGFIKYDVGGIVPELTVGGNVRTATVNENDTSEYANCFIVKGSTRNMTYKAESGENLQSSTRLSLAQADDDEYPKSLIDTRTDKTLPKLTSILIFEDIFPQLDLYVYNVRARIRRMRDNEGNWVVNEYNADGTVKSYVTYATYYLRAAYPTVAEGHAKAWTDFAAPAANVVAGKKLTSYFIANEAGSHSMLAGREFEMIYHEKAQSINAQSDNDGVIDTGIMISSGDYEICFKQEGDLIIPNMTTLYPWGDGESLSELGDEGMKNDKMVLYNIVMTEDYTASAQTRLKETALKRISALQTDTNNYKVESNPIVFDHKLRIGQHVRYCDTEGRQLDTRVLSLITKLDMPGEVSITVGNNIIVGNTKQLKEEVASMNNNVSLLSTIFDATSSLSQSLNRAQKEMLESFGAIKEMWQFDKDGNVYSTRNVYTLQGLSAFGINHGSNPGVNPDGGGYQRLDSVRDYMPSMDTTHVLGAKVAKEIQDIEDRVENLENNPGGSDKHLVISHQVAEKTWNVTHNLGKYPSVTVITSDGAYVVGAVEYIDENSLRINFEFEFSGKVIMN